MQDIHSIGSGGGGRLFGGGGDRRLRPHNNQSLHQALKCPRCESLNTKFCYYNNYNLSQPRHFCKSCRRYWTKGGVLRNVPVGGGCRKTKRSSKPKHNSSDAIPQERKSSNSQNSSSDSSSLTVNTTAAITPTAVTAVTEVLSGSSSNSAPTLLNFQDQSRFFNIPNLDPPLIDQSSENGMFAEIGTFTRLIASSNDPLPLGFNIADISSFRLHQQNQGQVVENPSSNNQQWMQHQKMMEDEVKMQEMSAGFLDQTGQIEYTELQNRTDNGGLGAVDWQSGGDQGLFDLTATVDQSYWNQTQWTDHDHQLNYLP